MVSIDDNSALLLYRVGPVLCCAPCLPVSAIIVPPALTHPPGSSPGRPGIFKHANIIVRELDLRHQFGVDESAWRQPGRSIVTSLDRHHIGFHVDEIEDVIRMPTTGWGVLPPLLPRGIFSRTLLHKEKIYLYAEFGDLQHIPHSGYLRQYIQQLLATTSSKQVESATMPVAGIKRQAQTQKPVETTASGHKAQSAQERPRPAPAPPPVSPPAQSSTTASLSARSTPSPLRSVPANPVHATRALQSQTASTNAKSQAAKRKIIPIQAPVDSATRATPRQTEPGRPAHATRTVTHTARFPTTPEDNRTWLVGSLLLVLFIGIFSAGIWYVFRDSAINTVSNTPKAITVVQRTQAIDSPASGQQPITPPAQASQASAVAATTTTHQDIPVNTNTGTDTHETPVASGTAKTHAIADKHMSNNGNYHASIDKDAQGITITVDVPSAQPGAPVATTAGTPATTPASQVADAAGMTGAAHVPAPTATTPASVKPVPSPTAVKTQVIIHIVAKGDTLWAIAKRYVKDPFRYPELARLSKIRNPDLIYPGDRVRIIKRIHDAN